MRKNIYLLLVILLIASLSMGCIDNFTPEPTYTVTCNCLLDSYTESGLTFNQAQSMVDHAGWTCNCHIRQE